MKHVILTLSAVILLLGSCNNETNKAALTAHEWQLKEMRSSDGNHSLPQRVPTILFSDSSAVYGFSGCNRYMGRYELKGNKLTIDPGASTMMACPELEFEDIFKTKLANIKSLTITDNELKLKGEKEDEYMIFIPKEEEKIIVDEEKITVDEEKIDK